jgi:crotonobetaine/carnitine-CoA ligase
MNGEARSAGEMLEMQARRLGDQPFIRCDGDDWVSYAELDQRSSRTAGGLHALGVERGDRVAILADNSVEFAEVVFACSKLGAVEVPINVYLRGEFLRHQIADSGARAAIVDTDGRRSLLALGDPPALKHVVVAGADQPDAGDCIGLADLRHGATPLPPVRPSSGELGAIMYTSGTTGPAKGCMIPHGMFVAPMATYARAGYLRPGDRVLTPSPMFHMGCQSAMLMAPLAVGASVCFLKRFSASEFMRTAREIEATVLYGVGAAAIAILRRLPDPLDAANTLRCAIWTPLAPPQADEFERRFDVWTSSEAYGQTEFLPITLGDVEKSPVRGSAGMPVEIAEVKVFDEDGRSVGSVEVGEICVRPRRPDVMSKGYWKSPEASLRSISNLWHHTGDLGRLDEDGRLWIVDRKVDALRRRGENISSTEIEAAIVRHPSVEEAAVVGVASEMSEQDVKAYLRLAPSTRISPVELFEFFREELPYFSIPRYVDLVEEFPVNALGRIQKDRLRQLGNTSETWDFDAMGYSVDPGDRR